MVFIFVIVVVMLLLLMVSTKCLKADVLQHKNEYAIDRQLVTILLGYKQLVYGLVLVGKSLLSYSGRGSNFGRGTVNEQFPTRTVPHSTN